MESNLISARQARMIDGIHGISQFVESKMTGEAKELIGITAGAFKLASRGKKDFPKSSKKGLSWMIDVLEISIVKIIEEATPEQIDWLGHKLVGLGGSLLQEGEEVDAIQDIADGQSISGGQDRKRQISISQEIVERNGRTG